MTPPPEFEEIVGGDVEAAERARLARVHALLVQAGPPPELSPELESGPTLGMTLARRPARGRRRGEYADNPGHEERLHAAELDRERR